MSTAPACLSHISGCSSSTWLHECFFGVSKPWGISQGLFPETKSHKNRKAATSYSHLQPSRSGDGAHLGALALGGEEDSGKGVRKAAAVGSKQTPGLVHVGSQLENLLLCNGEGKWDSLVGKSGAQPWGSARRARSQRHAIAQDWH